MVQEDELQKIMLENKRLAKENEYYRHLAEIDSMCDVYNKRTVEHLIKEQLKQKWIDSRQRQKQPYFAMGILDIDNLKKINDTYGHAEGDHAIKIVAQSLVPFFREKELLGRIGGDEFMFWIPEVKSGKELETKLHDIWQQLQEPMDGRQGKIYVSCSIGVVVAIEEFDFDALYRHADAVMYRVKESTKNRYHIEHI